MNCSKLGAATEMSSINDLASGMPARIFTMARWKNGGAFVGPKRTRVGSKSPRWQMNAKRGRLSLATGICRYPLVIYSINQNRSRKYWFFLIFRETNRCYESFMENNEHNIVIQLRFHSYHSNSECIVLGVNRFESKLVSNILSSGTDVWRVQI